MNDAIQQIPPSEIKKAATELYYQSPEGLIDFFPRELKIATKAIGAEAKISFKPNPVQIPILRAAARQLYKKGKIRQLIFKCRQIGGSTYSSGVIWNRVSIFKGVYAFIVAQDKGTVANIFQMHDVFYSNMNPLIRPTKKYYNKGTEVVFGDSGEEDDSLDSRLLVGEAKNIHLGVGRTIHALHGSEVPRWPSSDPIKEALIPACSDFPGSVRIFEGTAHFGGGADWFRTMCERAMAGDGEYDFFFVEWWKMPEYQIPLDRGEKLKLDTTEKVLVKKYGVSPQNIKWRRAKLDELEGDEDSFKLSYPMNYEEAWISRETTAFPQDRVMELHAMLRPPQRRFRIEAGKIYEHPEGELWVWYMPEKGKVYDIGADVAEGHQDGDWSTAEIVERGSNIQCAEYQGHIIPSDFAVVLAVLGRMYNNAQIGPEVNSIGIETAHELVKIYPYVYLWRKQDVITPKFTGLLGWQTNYNSKLILVGLAHKRLFHRQVQIFSRRLWDEMRNFGRDYTETGMITYRAVTGHDDLVMAWCISLKISDDENFHYNEIGTEPVRQEVRDPATFDSEASKLFGGRMGQDETAPWE